MMGIVYFILTIFVLHFVSVGLIIPNVLNKDIVKKNRRWCLTIGRFCKDFGFVFIRNGEFSDSYYANTLICNGFGVSLTFSFGNNFSECEDDLSYYYEFVSIDSEILWNEFWFTLKGPHIKMLNTPWARNVFLGVKYFDTDTLKLKEPNENKDNYSIIYSINTGKDTIRCWIEDRSWTSNLLKFIKQENLCTLRRVDLMIEHISEDGSSVYPLNLKGKLLDEYFDTLYYSNTCVSEKQYEIFKELLLKTIVSYVYENYVLKTIISTNNK